MVKVQSVEWHDEAWEVHFEIKEGVYRLEDYPVRITHLGHYEVDGFADAVATVATGLLRSHMRRGAVPPHAVVVNWSRVDQLTHGAPEEVKTAIRQINESRAYNRDSAVSSQF